MLCQKQSRKRHHETEGTTSAYVKPHSSATGSYPVYQRPSPFTAQSPPLGPNREMKVSSIEMMSRWLQHGYTAGSSWHCRCCIRQNTFAPHEFPEPGITFNAPTCSTPLPSTRSWNANLAPWGNKQFTKEHVPRQVQRKKSGQQ